MVKLADKFSGIPDKETNPLAYAAFMVGALPTAIVVTAKEAPSIAKFLASKPAYVAKMGKALGPGIAAGLVAHNTAADAEQRGQDYTGAGVLSTLGQLEAGQLSEGKPSLTGKAVGGTAKIADTVADIGRAVRKPTRKGVLKAATAAPRVGTALAKGGYQLAKAAPSIAKGMGLEAVGTVIGSGSLVALSETGALKGLYDSIGADISQEDIDRHVKDFVTTEVGGVDVPNIDPINSVLKTTGAIQDLHEVNQERGYHGDDALSTGRFVRDEISDELGGGIIGDTVGTGAGLIVGGVTGVGNVAGKVLDKVWPF